MCIKENEFMIYDGSSPNWKIPTAIKNPTQCSCFSAVYPYRIEAAGETKKIGTKHQMQYSASRILLFLLVNLAANRSGSVAKGTAATR